MRKHNILLLFLIFYNCITLSQQEYKTISGTHIIAPDTNNTEDYTPKTFKAGIMFNILGQAPSAVSVSLDFFPIPYISIEGGYGYTSKYSFYGGGKFHLPINKKWDMYLGI